jgi:hypothetical protein
MNTLSAMRSASHASACVPPHSYKYRAVYRIRAGKSRSCIPTWLETIAVKDFEAALETNRLTFIRGDKLKGAGIRGSCLRRALRVS